jgi:uncharacterized protein (DUF2236 family)
MADPVAPTDRCTPSLPVTRGALEDRLARLRSEVRDPRAGLFGPDSKVWEVNKEAISFLGAGRAALLQLAHPWVASGIAQHSRTRDDPFGRFQRTFQHVFRMVYGDLESALRSARIVHAIHERVTGVAARPRRAAEPYRANEPHALLWVHATLWDTSVLCYEAVVRPLAPSEKDRYYAETRRFAALFGIPDEVLPADWSAFRRYVDGMLAGDVLVVTPPAAEMARFLLRPLLPGTGPLVRRAAELTAWWLPEPLARGFGLARGGETGRRRTERLLRRAGRVWPHVPRRLRYLPAYVEARRRLAGRTGPDPVGAALGRLWVGGDRLRGTSRPGTAPSRRPGSGT